MEPQPLKYTALQLQALSREQIEELFLERQDYTTRLIDNANKAEGNEPNGKRAGLELSIIELKRLGHFVIPQEVMGQWVDALTEACAPRVPFYWDANNTMMFDAYRAVNKIIHTMLREMNDYIGQTPGPNDPPF